MKLNLLNMKLNLIWHFFRKYGFYRDGEEGGPRSALSKTFLGDFLNMNRSINQKTIQLGVFHQNLKLKTTIPDKIFGTRWRN